MHGEGKEARALEANIGSEGALALTREIVRGGFFDLPARASVSSATDQRSPAILVRDGQRWHAAFVYGLRRAGEPVGPSGEAPPPAFMSAYHRLISFEAPGATASKPERIEIMLWGFDYAGSSVAWPDAIPRPPATATPPDGGVFRHYVDGKYANDISAFTRTLGGKAVDLNEHKWAFEQRACVPEEDYLEEVERALSRAGR